MDTKKHELTDEIRTILAPFYKDCEDGFVSFVTLGEVWQNLPVDHFLKDFFGDLVFKEAYLRNPELALKMETIHGAIEQQQWLLKFL